jgi:hypothetical protein
MQDFIKSHYNKDVSTEDLKQTVEQHMTPLMNLDGNGRMDWFFNEYVYGTEMPSYRLEYSVNGNTVTASVAQTGVSDNFHMVVPVYADFGKGWVRLGTTAMHGNSVTNIGPLDLGSPPKRLAVAAFKDVLALSVENKKK